MTATASGYEYPATGYTSGWRQGIQDLADSAEDVILEAGIPRYADAATRNAALPAPAAGSLSALATERFVRRATGSGTTWKPYGSGLLPIIPSSVAGTNVTLGADGVVTAAAATSASLNGCFTSDFDNYRVIYDITNKSANVDFQARLRLAGADITTSNYNNTRQTATSTAGIFQALAAALFIIDTSPGAVNSYGRGTIDIFAPALATPTGIEATTHGAVGNTNLVTIKMSGHHSLSTAYDGITFYPASGTITGTIRVYGYNNL